MVARGLPDPYCRWVPPSEFAAMKKYDVTGVGLNLGTAEEYVKKTVGWARSGRAGGGQLGRGIAHARGRASGRPRVVWGFLRLRRGWEPPLRSCRGLGGGAAVYAGRVGVLLRPGN
jgi:hypothetical protein